MTTKAQTLQELSIKLRETIDKDKCITPSTEQDYVQIIRNYQIYVEATGDDSIKQDIQLLKLTHEQYHKPCL